MPKIRTVKAPDDADIELIIDKILSSLKANGEYSPDLMYRGVNVTKEGLEKVKRYGTDRNPEDIETAKQRYRKSELYSADLEIAQRLQKEGYEKNVVIEHFTDLMSSPNFIWAYPEEGLEECLETYAFKNNIPVILVYRPESLTFYGLGSDEPLYRTPVPELLLKEREAMVQGFTAIYEFVPGISPADALVAVYRIDLRRTTFA